MDWVLIIFGIQVIKKKRSVQPVFPDYLSVSYDYEKTDYYAKISDTESKYFTTSDYKIFTNEIIDRKMKEK